MQSVGHPDSIMPDTLQIIPLKDGLISRSDPASRRQPRAGAWS